jgi:hypothetical protein
MLETEEGRALLAWVHSRSLSLHKKLRTHSPMDPAQSCELARAQGELRLIDDIEDKDFPTILAKFAEANKKP